MLRFVWGSLAFCAVVRELEYKSFKFNCRFFQFRRSRAFITKTAILQSTYSYPYFSYLIYFFYRRTNPHIFDNINRLSEITLLGPPWSFDPTFRRKGHRVIRWTILVTVWAQDILCISTCHTFFRLPTLLIDRRRYNLVFLLVTYLLPVAAMAFCYSLMGRELWGSKSIGEQTQRQLDNIKSKRKVVRMFITVIVIFAICWLPYHGYFIYVYHNNSVAVSEYIPHLYLSFYWLAMSNAMVNPIIYYWMNNRFRIYFKQILCLCCCMRPITLPDHVSTTAKRHPRSELILRSKSCKPELKLYRSIKRFQARRSAVGPRQKVYTCTLGIHDHPRKRVPKGNPALVL
ncbi:unnamed protein product [Nesidiocoris tenuis]|uniref:G-protein coupled receptors family 1 profile domain-containing protein n=1 Tax=Nesidiocoris tenuis TaxID=355587 RepID=A0A6H5GUR2_9HEMI|nr:unnamed protein product [Nesidiocoris tenuis]